MKHGLWWSVVLGLGLLACESKAPVVAASAALEFSEQRLDFGAPLNGTTVSRTVTIKNNGSAALQITRVSIDALADHTEFETADEGAVSWALKSGDSRVITVKLTPKDEVVDTDRLCVDSNDSVNQHACVALTSHVEGSAVLCGCVVDAGVTAPTTSCDLSTQRIVFPPVVLGETETRVVAFEDCGTGNQPLTIGDHNDLYFSSAAQGLSVSSFSEAKLTKQQSFPVVLQPAGLDELMTPVLAKKFYAKVSFTPFATGAQPRSQLCIAFRGEAGPKTSCLEVAPDAVVCPANRVDLDHSAANGCECVVSPEVCDGADNDCDGLIDNVDDDHDRYYACEFWAARDCDDTNSTVHPGALELCNLRDDNCNNFVDEGVTIDFGQDLDADGYANPAARLSACVAPTSSWKPMAQLQGFDCNDINGNIHPRANEVCNGADDNCNGLTDDGLPQLAVYLDLDGDGFAAANATRYSACNVPIGYTQARDANGDGVFDPDCNDSNITAYPGAPELCDGLLNNCLRTIADQTCAHQCPGSWPSTTIGTSSGEVLVGQLDSADNELEVLVTGGSSIQVLGHDGHRKWAVAGSSGFSHPSVADVDLSGTLEVVHALNGVVSVLNGATGATLATFNGGSEGGEYGFVGAADLDNDGHLDLVSEGSGSRGRALFLGDNFTLLSTQSLTVPAPQFMSLALPIIYDFDGDGFADIAWNTASWSCSVGANCLFRVPVMQVDGGQLYNPESTFSVPFRDTGYGGEGVYPSVADLDHDGTAEVLLTVTNKAGPDTGTYVWRLDGTAHPNFVGPQSFDPRTLAPVDSSGTLTAGKLNHVGGSAIDLNGDGKFEIVGAGSAGLVITQAGRLLPGYPTGAPGSTPVITDLDLDGTLEVLYIGSSDQRVHCFELGPETYAPLRIAGPGPQGWNNNNMLTRALDPYEPNDPGSRSVDLTAISAATALRQTHAMSLAPFTTKLQSGIGWSRQLVATLGTRNDRDFYWGSGTSWLWVDLSVPSWAPVHYDVKAYFYNRTTGAYVSTLVGSNGQLYCHAASNPCPASGDFQVLLEVLPRTPDDFGPWPYQLVTHGTF